MVGTIDEAYFSELQQRDADESQQSLFDYSDDEEEDSTTIAVVSKPTGGIRDVTDEFIPALGMPKAALEEFQSLRGQLTFHNSVEEHNKAFEMCDLEDTYETHLHESKEAREAIQSLISRLQNGENITLVCFEKPPKRCHRHVLLNIIKEQIAKSA